MISNTNGSSSKRSGTFQKGVNATMSIRDSTPSTDRDRFSTIKAPLEKEKLARKKVGFNLIDVDESTTDMNSPKVAEA